MNKVTRIEAYYQEYLELRKRGTAHETALKNFETWLSPISLARLSQLIKSRATG